MRAATALACIGLLGASSAHADKAKVDRIAAFRARNPQTWTTVTLGRSGFINHAVTSDPSLQIRTLDKDGHDQWDDAAIDRVRAVLRDNADLFGIDAADADRVHAANGNVAYVDNDTGFELVGIVLSPDPGLGIVITTPRIHLTPKLTDAQVAARFIGHAYVARSESLPITQRDCHMGDPARCGARRAVETQRRVITADDVGSDKGVITYKGAPRLLQCVDLGQTAPGVPDEIGAWSVRLRPLDGGPTVPFVIDVVTGARVAVTGASCGDVWRRLVK